MNKLIKQIQNDISYQMELTSLGFDLNSFEDSFSIFLKPKNDIFNKIVFSLFPVEGKAFFSQLNYSIISQQVNSVMSFLDSGFNLLEDTLMNRQGFYDSQKVREDISVLVLEEKEIREDNILVVGDLFKKYYSTYALPFFSKFQSLQDINDKILEKEEFSSYYKYIFGETGAKVLIIMKLCHSDKYQEYKNWSDNIIEKQLADPMYEDYKNILINQQKIMDKVYTYLESGAYRNLLNE